MPAAVRRTGTWFWFDMQEWREDHRDEPGGSLLVCPLIIYQER
jgi:hypothetical protein